HSDTVYDFAERRRSTRVGFGRCRLPAPLAQKLAAAVEHGDAPVAIAVGNIDVAVAGIDRDTRRIEELLGAGIEAGGPPGPIGGIETAALADLQQQPAIGSIFLDDAVAVACDVEIVVAVDHATMNRARHDIALPPGGDEIAGGIELHDRRRRF